MIAARAANLQVAMKALALAVLALAYAAATARAEQCGRQAGGARCPTGSAAAGGVVRPHRRLLQGRLPEPVPRLPRRRRRRRRRGAAHGAGRRPRGVASVVTSDQFERMLPHRDDAACPAAGSTPTAPSSPRPARSGLRRHGRRRHPQA